MSIYKPLKEVASLAGDLAIDLAKGKSIIATTSLNNGFKDVPCVLHDTYVITKDNLVELVVKQGFHTYDEIYAGLPESQRPPRPN